MVRMVKIRDCNQRAESKVWGHAIGPIEGTVMWRQPSAKWRI